MLGLIKGLFYGICALIIIGAIASAFDRRSPDEVIRDNSAKNCTSESSAHAMAEKFVTNSLRAPSTAKFARYSDSKIEYLGNCRHRVVSYVDSQNGFGAMIRTRYVAVVKSTGFDGKQYNYTLESLDMGQ